MAKEKSKQTEKQDSETDKKPRSLRQSLLVPAVLVAVIGLVGVLFQEPLKLVTQAALNTVFQPENPGADRQDKLITFLKRNLDCTKARPREIDGPGDIRVFALVCQETRDIYFEFWYNEKGVVKKKLGGIMLYSRARIDLKI